MIYLEDRPRNRFVRLSLQDETSLIRTWGRLGTAGASATQGFRDAYEAEHYYQRVLLKLCKRGYVPGHQNPAMIRDIARAPDQDGPRSVYGDWLLAEGDPRGQLIALQSQRQADPQSAELQERESKLLHTYADWLLGEWAADAAFRWHLGFATTARLPMNTSAIYYAGHITGRVRRLLRHPTGLFLRELVLEVRAGFGYSEYPWRTRWPAYRTQVVEGILAVLSAPRSGLPQLLERLTFVVPLAQGDEQEVISVPASDSDPGELTVSVRCQTF